MSIKAVIFDLDGTLLDTLGDLASAVNTALRHHGFPLLDEDDVCGRVGNGVRRLIEQSVPAGTPRADIDACLAEFQAAYDQHLVERTHPYQGIPAVIEAFHRRGVRMAVLSNKYQAATAKLVARFFPEGTFDVVFGQREGIEPKPDPTIVFDILKQVGIAPEATLYMGDSKVDMQTAANSGLRSVGVTWGFRPRAELEEHGATFIIDRPEQLLDLL